jgi:hypothetical protein
VRRMDFFRAVRKTVRHFSDCPKNRPTSPFLALKMHSNHKGNSPDSPCCDITYTYNLHVSEINMSIRPLTYRRWRSGCNSLNIIY